MIAVRPDNLPGRALRLIVHSPGEHDAGSLAAHLLPLPPVPTEGWAAYLAWRAQVSVVRSAPRKKIKRQKGDWLPDVVRPARTVAVVNPEGAAKMSRYLSGLQQRGLIYTAGAPVLSDWYIDAARRRGYEAALATCLHERGAEHAPAILALIMQSPC